MHFLSYVLIPTKEDHVVQVAEILAPFDVNEAEIEDGVWDWYQIGGRWTGFLSGYDPDTDPKNIEVCWLCGGTGKRNDEIGRRMRAKDPSFTCNGCQGKGESVSWPTKWGEHDGDVFPLDDIPEDKAPPHTLFYKKDGEPVAAKKGWSFNEPDFPGWDRTDKNDKKRDEIEARVEAEHRKKIREILAEHKGKGYFVVLVDYHS